MRVSLCLVTRKKYMFCLKPVVTADSRALLQTDLARVVQGYFARFITAPYRTRYSRNGALDPAVNVISVAEDSGWRRSDSTETCPSVGGNPELDKIYLSINKDLHFEFNAPTGAFVQIAGGDNRILTLDLPPFVVELAPTAEAYGRCSEAAGVFCDSHPRITISLKGSLNLETGELDVMGEIGLVDEFAVMDSRRERLMAATLSFTLRDILVVI